MEVMIKPNIKDMIYEVRGYQVMLDKDVAQLYGYETKRINESVKNNIDRFPDNFCFRLTKKEYFEICSRSKISTLNNEIGRGNNIKYIPYVFTEYGILMLAGILKSDIAVNMSIRIVDAFVSMRKFINSNKDLFKRVITIENNINTKFIEYDKNFELLFKEFDKEELKEKIFFSGEIYDAYSLLIKLISSAEEKIIIIDNYLDNSILDALTKKKSNVEVTLVTKGTNINKLDIDKFNKEYPNIKLVINNSFHDRFIIIDNSLYHLGASLKDLGNKCFAINKIEDTNYLNTLMGELWK